MPIGGPRRIRVTPKESFTEGMTATSDRFQPVLPVNITPYFYQVFANGQDLQEAWFYTSGVEIQADNYCHIPTGGAGGDLQSRSWFPFGFFLLTFKWGNDPGVGVYEVVGINGWSLLLEIIGTTFRLRTIDEERNTETTTLTWNADYADNVHDYTVWWTPEKVQLLIDNVVVATHRTVVPLEPGPIYFYMHDAAPAPQDQEVLVRRVDVRNFSASITQDTGVHTNPERYRQQYGGSFGELMIVLAGAVGQQIIRVTPASATGQNLVFRLKEITVRHTGTSDTVVSIRVLTETIDRLSFDVRAGTTREWESEIGRVIGQTLTVVARSSDVTGGTTYVSGSYLEANV